MAKAAGIPTMLHSCGKSRVLVDLLCDETDIDCGGGTCPTCPDGWYCIEDIDCTSDACLDDLCFPCDSARLTWNAPTSYTDGTCLRITDLWGFKLYYGTISGGPYPNIVPISVADAGCFETTTPDPRGCGNLWECTYTVDNLTDGTWYFSLSAVDNLGAESELATTRSRPTSSAPSSTSRKGCTRCRASRPCW